MDRFIRGSVVWPTGWTHLHVYVLPNLAEANPVDTAQMGALINATRDVIRAYPALSIVSDAWLHITVQMITGRPARDVTVDERNALVAALHRQLADVPPFQVTVGPPMATQAVVLLDVNRDLPGEPFHLLAKRIDAGIDEVLGDEALRYEPSPPHISLAYAAGPEDSGVIQSQLRQRVRPGRATMRVDAVHLVDVVQDAERSQYRWTPVARIPLSSPTSRGPVDM